MGERREVLGDSLSVNKISLGDWRVSRILNYNILAFERLFKNINWVNKKIVTTLLKFFKISNFNAQNEIFLLVHYWIL